MPKTKLSEPRILFLDIETFPNLSYTWGKYEQDVIRFKQQTCIATVAYKWRGSNKVEAKALPDYRGYKSNSYDDASLVKDLWKLLDEADIVVAHNGNSFDLKVIQGRFLFHGLEPPSPYKSVDTKLLTKAVARFNSNKLDDLGQLFFQERKIKTDFDLWEGCIHGDSASWKQMVTYNKKDVELLEKLYDKLLPYARTHPNVSVYKGGMCCPKCGSERLQSRGYTRSVTRVYRRYHCTSCGGWSRSTVNEKDMSVGITNV
jgi:RNase_H superfamily